MVSPSPRRSHSGAGNTRSVLDYQIHNASARPWSFAPYAQILRYNTPIERSYFQPDSYAFKGPAYLRRHQVPEVRRAEERRCSTSR